MFKSRFSRVLCVGVTATVLAGCGGSQTPISAPLVTRIGNPQTSPCPCIYVADGGNSIEVFPISANGNVPPIQYISGSNTQLYAPEGIAVDASGNMYVANIYPFSGSVGYGSVTIYAAGGTGNVAPIAVISGPSTGLDHPSGIALDPVNGDIYVANVDLSHAAKASITIYSPGANGNVAPIGVIKGASTGLICPGGLALDASGNIYVPNTNINCNCPSKCGVNNRSITVYSAGSHGNTAPTRKISGSKTKLHEPNQLALDSRLRIWVVNALGDQYKDWVNVYAAAANGNVGPKRLFYGTKPQLSCPEGIALDASDNVYVANCVSDPLINVYAAGSFGDIAPNATIQGSYTELYGPRGIAIR